MCSSRTHGGVACECCKTDIKGSHYKCLICINKDLCQSCYYRKEEFLNHKNNHPMQCVLSKTHLRIFLGGQGQAPAVIESFICPFCSKMGFTPILLAEHANTEHSDRISERVSCPICVALTESDCMVSDLGHHISVRHQPALETYEDLSVIEMRRIQHRGIAPLVATRMRMNTQFTHFVDINKETNDPLSEILSHLSVTRSTTVTHPPAGSTTPNLQINLFPVRNQLERFQHFDSSRESLFILPFSPLSAVKALDSQLTIQNKPMVLSATSSTSSSCSSEIQKVKENVASNFQSSSSEDKRKQNGFVLNCLQMDHNARFCTNTMTQKLDIALFAQELVLLSISIPNFRLKGNQKRILKNRFK